MSSNLIFPHRRTPVQTLWPRGNLLAQMPGFPWPLLQSTILNQLVDKIEQNSNIRIVVENTADGCDISSTWINSNNDDSPTANEITTSFESNEPSNTQSYNVETHLLPTTPADTTPIIDITSDETIEVTSTVDTTQLAVEATQPIGTIASTEPTFVDETLTVDPITPALDTTQPTENQSVDAINTSDNIPSNEDDMLKSWVVEEQKIENSKNNDSFIMIEKDDELVFPSTVPIVAETEKQIPKIVSTELGFTKSQLTKKTVPQLKSLCVKFQLSTNGNKPDLIDRILQHQEDSNHKLDHTDQQIA